jgi:hypothetical protein
LNAMIREYNKANLFHSMFLVHLTALSTTRIFLSWLLGKKGISQYILSQS